MTNMLMADARFTAALSPQVQDQLLYGSAGSAARQVQEASQVLSSSTNREQIEASMRFARQNTARAYDKAINDLSRLVMATVTMRQFGAPPAALQLTGGNALSPELARKARAGAPEGGARWQDYAHKGAGDCSYFGSWIYDQTACSEQNIATLIFAFDLYKSCWEGAQSLLRTNPDTFGIIDFVDYIENPSVLDERCTHPDIARADQASLARKVTWRGYARALWYRQACRFTSGAFWALNVRTGFLYGIGMGERTAQSHGFPVGEPWENAAGEELWAWGPDKVKEQIAYWWQATTAIPDQRSRNTGTRLLFMPLSTQSFLSATRDPGLDAAWVWGAEGNLINEQTRAELRRGQQRRSARVRARTSNRMGFYQAQAMFDAVGGGRVQASRDAKQAAPGTFLPEHSMLPILEQAAVFSTRGAALVPVRNVLERGDDWWSMPTGDLLVEHTKVWLREVAELDPVDHLMRANLIYLDYLKRFEVFVPLAQFDAERQALLIDTRQVVEQNGVAGVYWIEAAQMTLKEVDEQLRELRKIQVTKRTGAIMGAVAGVATAVLGATAVLNVVPVAGWIAYAVVVVLMAIAVFFAWLFGGRLQGCPKAPRPMVMRTVDDPECSTDIATSERTLDQAWQNQVNAGLKVGINFVLPKGGFMPPAPAGDTDWQFPGLPPLEPEPEGWSLGAKVALGVAALGAAALLLNR